MLYRKWRNTLSFMLEGIRIIVESETVSGE